MYRYVPGTKEVISVAEFYLSIENLEHEIHAAQLRSWLLVAVAALSIYLLLFGLVCRADQDHPGPAARPARTAPPAKYALDENEHMRGQLREAGVSTTTLNEEFLIRIAADLHDGPAQAIAFALMRYEEFSAGCLNSASPPSGAIAQDLRSIHDALQSSLRDVRKISSGLAMPDIAGLSLSDTARRAVQDFEHMSGQTIRDRDR